MSTVKQSNLQGKVALVTGASKGIGAAIARELGSRGAAVAVNYSGSKAGADKVVAEIQAAGGGLGEYYSERDMRAPTWMVAGDKAAVGELVHTPAPRSFAMTSPMPRDVTARKT